MFEFAGQISCEKLAHSCHPGFFGNQAVEYQEVSYVLNFLISRLLLSTVPVIQSQFTIPNSPMDFSKVFVRMEQDTWTRLKLPTTFRSVELENTTRDQGSQSADPSALRDDPGP